MNRRNLFKGLAGVAGALILPATLEENAEAGKRIWALGGIPSEIEVIPPMPIFGDFDIIMDERVPYGQMWFEHEGIRLYTFDWIMKKGYTGHD